MTGNQLALRPRRLLPLVLLLLTAACSRSLQSQSKPTREEIAALKAAPALILAPIAGQSVPVMPVTYLIAPDSLPGLPADLPHRLLWADSLVGQQLAMRGPEVTWIFPPELRSLARRAPGSIKEPEKMGQALLRSPGLKTAPDAFLTNLRPLIAMASARYVIVPASVRLNRVADGVEAAVILVMVDGRTGQLMWRSEPVAKGATAAAALTAIFPRILPDNH